MNADAFRQVYDYHFALNRKLWDQHIATLTDAQFTNDLGYSHGSIRNQVVHLFNVDDRWFAGLRGQEIPDFVNPVHFADRGKIRVEWDRVEADMRAYLGTLTDEMLLVAFDQFAVWQVLFHVLNHGTDHRAQLLAMLGQLGIETGPQDYILHVMGRI